MRETIGRLLCFALGALYPAGLIPLFTFGDAAKQLWSWFEGNVLALTDPMGIPQFLVTYGLGTLTFAGPLALVWFIAGSGVKRIMWIFLGLIAYGAYWWFGHVTRGHISSCLARAITIHEAVARMNEALRASLDQRRSLRLIYNLSGLAWRIPRACPASHSRNVKGGRQSARTGNAMPTKPKHDVGSHFDRVNSALHEVF